MRLKLIWKYTFGFMWNDNTMLQAATFMATLTGTENYLTLTLNYDPIFIVVNSNLT